MNEAVQKWLKELTAEPVSALQRLVLGQVAVSAWSRASLREIFIEVFQTHAEALYDPFCQKEVWPTMNTPYLKDQADKGASFGAGSGFLLGFGLFLFLGTSFLTRY